VRELNEDGLLQRDDVALWAVADGMGGHHAGDVASRRVIEALGAIDRPGSGYAYLTAVRRVLEAVNLELVALASGAVVGSTVVALLVHEEHYACLWAGDSRAYRVGKGALEPITRDHSMVQELIDSGAITPAEARTHRRANVITRAVGAGPALELDVRNAQVRAGDRFLLCSDGLTGALTDQEISGLAAAPDLAFAADALMDAALDRGARDNVTLVLIEADR
jgi:serine/threonine protein phosphatase PrpC